MKSKQVKLVKSILGEDFFDELKKNDVYHPDTRVVTSINEVKIGLQIVPRAILSYLKSSLGHLEKGDLKTLILPWGNGAKMDIQKIDSDVYHGEIYENGKYLNQFKYRSLYLLLVQFQH